MIEHPLTQSDAWARNLRLLDGDCLDASREMHEALRKQRGLTVVISRRTLEAAYIMLENRLPPESTR